MSSSSQAQEFNCDVTIDQQNLQGDAFRYLEAEFIPTVRAYINEFQWTEADILEQERINCQITVIFTSGNQSSFDFNAQVNFVVRRPIYGTNSETSSVLLSDNTWQFSFPQGTNLIHDEFQFDTVTGFLDFYMLTILGIDFDTFSDRGGTPYYERAQDIMNLAQSNNAVGWSRTANNRRNRFTLVTNLLNPAYYGFRTAIYQYHRLGLDSFVQDTEASRTALVESLRLIRDAKRQTTDVYLYDIFFDTKYREIPALFDGAETDQRLELYAILQEADQGHLSEYEQLQN
ncbi:MAG: DUF4835 family protein [Bacteroidota bacterium]